MLLTAGAGIAAYIQSGQAGKFIGVMGFAALFLSAMGLHYSVRGLRQEDVYRLFPWLGFALNWMALAVFIMIYILGW